MTTDITPPSPSSPSDSAADTWKQIISNLRPHKNQNDDAGLYSYAIEEYLHLYARNVYTEEFALEENNLPGSSTNYYLIVNDGSLPVKMSTFLKSRLKITDFERIFLSVLIGVIVRESVHRIDEDHVAILWVTFDYITDGDPMEVWRELQNTIDKQGVSPLPYTLAGIFIILTFIIVIKLLGGF